MKKLMCKLEKILEKGGLKKDIALLIISGIFLILSLFDLPFLFDPAWIAVVLCGIPIILEAAIGLITAFDIKADVLVSLALIASVAIGEIFAAGEVAFIMQLGGLLEDLTVAKSRAGIERLVHLTPQTARVIFEGTEKVIPAEEVQVGDLLRVLPGETVPVDGVIISGKTSVNEAVMTGESLPVDKEEGDLVSSGTVNQFGAFDMRAQKVGEDSSIQRMIRLVQSADAKKAKIVGLADRWATWIVILALTAAALTWLISGEIIRAVTILVVFCPCSLVLATPTAVMAGIGNASKHGFLIREGDALERLAGVSKITFDKTGTLTYGTPKVVHVKSIRPDLTDKDLYTLSAAAEQLSEHPLGRAVVQSFKRDTNTKDLPSCESFQMIPGRGVLAVINWRRIAAGNMPMIEEIVKESGKEDTAGCSTPQAEENIARALRNISEMSDEWRKRGCTVIYAAIDGEPAGFLALSDTVREAGSDMIGNLSALKVQPVLLTGDNENAAANIAGQLGIEKFHADCLPEDKLKFIASWQKADERVCMIGDGINDAPALKAADVGIAMGGMGSDIAIDAADIVLVDDKIEELPHLIALSHRMMHTIRFDLAFSMTLNVIAVILAIFGILNPVAGALVHNAGSVFVIICSASLLKWKYKQPA